MKKHQSIFFIASTITLAALYFILMMIMGGCKKTDTIAIKSSEIKDGAITVPKDCSEREKELSRTLFEAQQIIYKQQHEIDALLASEQELLKWKRDAMRRENIRLKK